VADNGSGFGATHPNTATSIAGGLANLIEADLAYYRNAEWTTVAEIVFPIELRRQRGRRGSLTQRTVTRETRPATSLQE
jgi:hypothetical protein